MSHVRFCRGGKEPAIDREAPSTRARLKEQARDLTRVLLWREWAPSTCVQPSEAPLLNAVPGDGSWLRACDLTARPRNGLWRRWAGLSFPHPGPLCGSTCYDASTSGGVRVPGLRRDTAAGTAALARKRLRHGQGGWGTPVDRCGYRTEECIQRVRLRNREVTKVCVEKREGRAHILR